MRTRTIAVLLAPFLPWLMPGRVTAAERVTFAETIAPIVYANCVSCHRPGEAAPFALITYDDVKRRGALVASVTESRYMPPWHAEHGYGEFAGERRLDEEQIAAIQAWVKDGMPQGDARKMPKLPQFTDGWQLGTPDLILEMPAEFTVPASGPDIYRNFAIPTRLTDDKWVRAIEFRPSARKAVHHALFSYVAGGAMKDIDGKDGKPGFDGLFALGVRSNAGQGGSLGGWAVGTSPRFLPDGRAMALRKDSDLLVQMHFHPTGKPERERSVIGIYFADTAPDRKIWVMQAPRLFGVMEGIDIPPGERNYTIKGSLTIPVEMQILSTGAHAHYLGKEMKATAFLPDGTTRPMLWIRNWDFNWQDRYDYKEPFVLPRGTRIDVTISYDNSADNLRNPSRPPKRVQWGEQSFDEMGSVLFQMATVSREGELFMERVASNLQRTLGPQLLQNENVRKALERMQQRQDQPEKPAQPSQPPK